LVSIPWRSFSIYHEPWEEAMNSMRHLADAGTRSANPAHLGAPNVGLWRQMMNCNVDLFEH
jgi:hypothetical protein